MLKHFIFGSSLAPAKTYEELKKERALADAALARLAGAYTSDLEAASARLGAEVGTMLKMAMLGSQLKEYDRKGSALFSELMSELTSSTSPASNAGSGVWTPGAIEWKPKFETSKGGAKNAKVNLNPEYAKVLAEGASLAASALGVSPADVLAIASYESAGTFNPRIRGPKTKYGRPVGLFQFLPANVEKYGYDPNDPMSQFKALVKYAFDRGYKPGMGVEALYATINAGSPHRLNARDAAQGGAPGTVLEKVRYQFAPHYRKAMTVLEIAKAAGADPDKLAKTLGVSKKQTFNLADEPTRKFFENLLSNELRKKESPEALKTAEEGSVRQALEYLAAQKGGQAGRQTGGQMDGLESQPDHRTSGNWLPELPPIPAPPPAPEITPPAQREKMYSTFLRTLQRIEGSPFLSAERKQALKLAVQTRLEALNQRFKAEDMQYQAWKDAYKEYYKNLAEWARSYNEMMLKARLNPMQIAPGNVVYDPITRKPLYRAPEKATELERMVAIENERRRRMGLPPMTPFEMKLLLERAGASQVNINTAEGADQAARKAIVNKSAQSLAELMDFAREAPQFDVRLKVLKELLQSTDTGGIPGHIKERLAQWGLGGSRIQAIQGIINWMVPRIKAKGMGVLSDTDLEMLKSTMPSLTKHPEANAALMRLLELDFEIKRKMADNVRRFQLGEYDYQTLLQLNEELRQEARKKAERSLALLFKLGKNAEGTGSKSEGGGIGSDVPPPDVPSEVRELWQFMTPEERAEVLRELNK